MNPHRAAAIVATFIFISGQCVAQARWGSIDEHPPVGLAMDTDRLVEYLTSGFPPEFVPVAEYPTADYAPLSRARHYRLAIAAAGHTDDQRIVAPLRQIQAGDLPNRMQADFDVWTAARPQFPTWQDWNRVENLEKDLLKAEATLALHQLTGESPENVMVTILDRLSREIVEIPDQIELRYPYWELLRLAYGSLSKTNVPTAIEALLSLLNNTDPPVRVWAGYELRMLTQQHFGPYDDTPIAVMDKDAKLWTSWWSTHREVFLGSNLADASVPREYPRPPAPVSVRDYVWWSITSTWSSDIPPPVDTNPGSIWLKAHAREHAAELRAIALDKSERTLIREVALEYLSDHTSKRNNDVLFNILRETTRNMDTRLQSLALELVQQHFSRKYDEALTICLNNESCAPAAANYLCASGGREVLTARLTMLEPKIRSIALNELLYRPTFGAMELALAGNNPKFAARALREARHPSILAGLSPGAIDRLADWRNDAWCQYWIIYESPRSELHIADHIAAMSAQRGVDPPAAAVFAHAYARTSDRHALDEFIRCVDAYRLSRGRSELLKSFDFAWAR